MPMETAPRVWQFWICILVVVGLLTDLVRQWRRPWSKPAAALYGTIIVWYIVNYLDDGPTAFKMTFGEATVGFAFLQVAAFLLCYRAALRWLVPMLVNVGKMTVPAGPKLAFITPAVLLGWGTLFLLGVALSGWNIAAIVWPPSSNIKISMFATPGMGSGNSFLISTAEYVYVLFCAWLGVLFVLEAGPYRWGVGLAILASWPYYWFGWTRNRMLALLLPMMACYYLFKPGRWLRKAVVGAAVFLGVYLWFLVVANFRSETTTQYLQILEQVDVTELNQVGLNMFEELCWSDTLIDQGVFKSNYGSNYFANAVNFVPRTLWPNKPLIGWDYAVARGLGIGEAESEGVYATISTGMIGQGVVNFGPYFGIPAAALLMALWTCFLARLWLQRRNLLRALLFLVGLGLTFNLGRDVTLLVLWPVVFGYGIVRALEAAFSPARKPQRLRGSGRRILPPTTTAVISELPPPDSTTAQTP